MKQVLVDNAAEMIGVSSATIRNWARAGYIIPSSMHPLSFLEQSVLDLKGMIGSNSFERLKTRANKVGSANNFLPEEYAENSNLASHIADIVASINDKDLELEPIMFLAALRRLEATGEVCKSRNNELFSIESYTLWARRSVKSAMCIWRSSLNNIKNEDRYSHIYELLFPLEGDDFLGLLYQSILREGDKSAQGSYYTSTKLVKDSLSYIEGPIETFLDPCCGSGKYLLLASKMFDLCLENIFGFDCDPIATNIARINLLMAYKDKDISPNVYCIDSLSELATSDMFCETNDLIAKFDAIATNPPWGAYKNSSIKRHFDGKVKSLETFSMFLEKSIQLLRMGGQLSFLLPESILKIKIHSDIRELILRETKISKISMLGRQFSGVFTPILRLDLIKETETDGWLVLVEQNGKSDHIAQDRFKNNEQFIFDIATESHEEDLLRKLYSIEHVTLSQNAEWALGIVTGDNKKYVFDEQEKGVEAVIRGSDISKYYLGEPRSFLHFTPNEYQQVAPERFFRSREKLIYKFISKNLVFAYDDRQRLTLNSANILIPSIPGMNIKVALAFLNSAVFQYIFTKKFFTHKVLRRDLEKLPFPLISLELHSAIEHLVDSALSNRKIPERLEEVISSSFGLDENEMYSIKQAITE